MAERIATALTSSGYRADFSPASLWDIDRFFDEQSDKGRPRRGGLLADETGARLFALGAYTGEVIRRAVGGTWSPTMRIRRVRSTSSFSWRTEASSGLFSAS